MNKKNIIDASVSLIIFTVILFLLLIDFKPIKSLEFLFIDIVSSLKTQQTSDSVILIGIDDKGIDSSDNWHLHRSKISEGLKTIESLGARLVVLDILYSEMDKNPGLQEIRNMIKKIQQDPSHVIKKDIIDLLVSLKMSRLEQKRYSDALLNASLSEAQKILISILSETEKRIDFDRLFVENISDTKNIVMPIDFVFGRKKQSNTQLSETPDYLIQNSIPVKCKDVYLNEATDLISPITAFAQKSYALGHIYFNTDYKILRTHDLFICHMDRVYPSLSLQSFIKFKNMSLEDTFDKYFNKSKLAFLTGETPARIYPNFNISNNIKYYSFIDVLSGQVDSAKIKDKIVIVGLNSNKLSGQIRVSGGKELSTIFIHGVILQNLIDNSYLKRSGILVLYEVAFLLILTFLVFLGVFKWRFLKLITLISLFVWIIFSAYLLLYHNLILQISYPVILSFAIFTVLFIRKRVYDREDMQKMAKDTFITKNIRILIGAKSDIGIVREKNEDSYCIDKAIGILAVADGVGGNIAGEIASKMAIDKVRSYIRDNYKMVNTDFSILMKNAIAFANNYVYGFALSNQELKGMATTLTAAFINGNRLIIGHVGDTRAYLFREGILEQLTEDHTVAVEKNIRNLSPSESEKMRHVLTRAIGIGQYVTVDTFELNLVKDDILLLCSDGLYSMVKESDIIANIRAYKEPEMVCGALINLANKNGGKDNITVITAFIQQVN